jgi:DNA-binding protein H-NS
VIAPKRHPTRKVEDLSSVSIDELWALHQTVAATLVAKITAEKEVIEDRLRLLNQDRGVANGNNHAGQQGGSERD